MCSLEFQAGFHLQLIQTKYLNKYSFASFASLGRYPKSTGLAPDITNDVCCLICAANESKEEPVCSENSAEELQTAVLDVLDVLYFPQ